ASVARAAHGGTLCLAGRRIPRGLDTLRGQPIRVILCEHSLEHAAPIALALGGTIAKLELTRLADRKDELPRMIESVAREAGAALAARDVAALGAQPFAGIAELEDATRKLVALRASGERALVRWAKRRGLSSL